MGGKQSSEKNQWRLFTTDNFHKFERDYIKVAEQTDQRFGKIDIYKNSNNEKYIFGMKQVFYNIQDMNKVEIDISNRGQLSHPNLLQIFGYKKQQYQELCGSNNILTIFVEYLENNLEEDIQYRADQEPKHYYPEYEIWTLLQEIVMGCCFLEEKGLHHGDIRPFNIFLTFDNSHARVCDNSLLNAIKNNYYKRLCGDIEVYLSPEQLEAFQNKEINPQFDVEKSDIYSLGMTILYALTLESPLQTVYDRINPYILQSNVDDQLIICKERYSFQLVDLLRQMLMQQPLESTFTKFYKIILKKRNYFQKRIS